MGKLKALIALLIIAVVVFVGWNIIPPYFDFYQFQDDLDELARRNSYGYKSEEDVKNLVIGKASTYGIPLREEQITLSRSADGLGIVVKYRIHIDIKVMEKDLDFTANSYNKRI